MPALRVETVTHAYGDRLALDAVSFDAPQGAFTALLGPNGAGKSTLFSLATRLFDTQQGAIRVLGFALDKHPGEALRRLGIVFQARTLDLDLSIAQNLVYHAALHGIAPRPARERGVELLTGTGLDRRLNDRVRTLSGGQLRLVEIVRALMHRPRVLLLDEPTVGLDMAARREVVARVRRLVTQKGVSVLWATHLIDEIEDGDRVVVLHEGRVRAQGEVSRIAARYGAGSIAEAFLHLTGKTPDDRRSVTGTAVGERP